MRLNNENLVDFIGQHLVQHAEGEGIAVGELVKVGKELGGGQPSMRREGGMRPRFASRQACALNVTDGDLKHVGGASLLAWCAGALDPLGRLMGMDGVLLLAFVLGFPANEIVLPIAVMGYLAQGSLGDSLGLAQMHALLTANGWTWTTAVSAVLFFLLHWPCSTTLWTIRRETGSTKWTLLAALLPTAMGMALCTAFTALARALGW